MHFEWHLRTWQELSRDELYKCIALRIEVFIIEQNCPYQDVDGKDVKSDHLFCTDESGIVRAYLRIVHPGISYPECSIGRVVNHLNTRNTGLGNELMRRAIEAVEKKWGRIPIRISAQLYLQKFYEKHGFVRLGETYLEDNIPHVEMLRDSW